MWIDLETKYKGKRTYKLVFRKLYNCICLQKIYSPTAPTSPYQRREKASTELEKGRYLKYNLTTEAILVLTASSSITALELQVPAGNRYLLT